MLKNFWTQNDAKKMAVSMIILNVAPIQDSVVNLIYGIFWVHLLISNSSMSLMYLLYVYTVVDQPRSRLMKYPILFKRIHKRVSSLVKYFHILDRPKKCQCLIQQERKKERKIDRSINRYIHRQQERQSRFSRDQYRTMSSIPSRLKENIYNW
jgi:hypothetical protein